MHAWSTNTGQMVAICSLFNSECATTSGRSADKFIFGEIHINLVKVVAVVVEQCNIA